MFHLSLLVNAAVTGILILSSTLSANPDRSADPRPNIILILADDLGYGNLGSYGQTLIQTPELDTLAAEGLRFTRFYSGAPLCLPSRVTLMTGLHMGHARVRENGGGGVHDPIQDEDTTLSTVLQAAGYRTAMIGKWALGDAFLGNTIPTMDYDGPGALYKHGWDYYLGEPNQSYNHTYTPSYIYRYDPQGFMGSSTPAGRLVTYPLSDDPETTDTDEAYTTDLYLKEALDYVDAAKDEPFFLYLPLQTPHRDFVVPSLEPYTTAKAWSNPEKVFASMISRMDRMIGDLVERLEFHGIEESTLLIFTSDNGGLANFDSRFDNNGPLPGYKGDASEGGLRVPCIAWWPGKIAAGGESAELLYFPDFMPTLSALAGIECPSPTDGISFIPTLFGSSGQDSHKYLFFLAGTEGVNPASQEYYIVKGSGETRTDEEIHAAAYQDFPTVPVFSRRRTASAPSIGSSIDGSLPVPEVRFEKTRSNALRMTYDIPDGVSYAVIGSTDLTEFTQEGDKIAFHRLQLGPDQQQQAVFGATDPASTSVFVRIDQKANVSPANVPENPAQSILLATDFTTHEPGGNPVNDTAPFWQTAPGISNPGVAIVRNDTGSIKPGFFAAYPDELAVDLNVTNESTWSIDIAVECAGTVTFSTVHFKARHFSNDGILKDSLAASFFSISILDSTGTTLDSQTIETPVSGNRYTVLFSTLTALPANSYTLRIRAEPNGDGRGNNQGIDDLSLHGFLTDTP